MGWLLKLWGWISGWRVAAGPVTQAQVPPVGEAAVADIRFRAQICCHTGAVASVHVAAPFLPGGDDTPLRLALRHWLRWRKDGIEPPPLAFDLPATMAQSPDLVMPLLWEIDRQEFPTDRLIFAAPLDAGPVEDQWGLLLLARFGCVIEAARFDVSDLGALRQLGPGMARLRLPHHALRDCHTRPGGGRMLLSLLAMAQRFGLQTLACDVASRDQHGFLAQLGCDIVQGEAVAPVLDASGMAQFLHAMTEVQRPRIGIKRPAA